MCAGLYSRTGSKGERKEEMVIGERERANLVVQLVRFFYIYSVPR